MTKSITEAIDELRLIMQEMIDACHKNPPMSKDYWQEYYELLTAIENDKGQSARVLCILALVGTTANKEGLAAAIDMFQSALLSKTTKERSEKSRSPPPGFFVVFSTP